MKKFLLFLAFAAICGTVSAQDLIVLRNADDIDAKVLRVTPSEIEYRKAENPDGPVYVLPVGDILFIKYQNGTKEVFSDTPDINQNLPKGHGPAEMPEQGSQTERYQHNPKLVTGPGPAYRPERNAPKDQTYSELYIDSFTPLRKPRFTHRTEHYPYYQGEVSVAYGLGVGEVSQYINTDRIAFETVHGARICPYFFAGAGLGFNYFYSEGESEVDGGTLRSSGAGVLPVFANFKGYYPINAKTALFLSLDLGAAIPISGYMQESPTQFYMAVGPSVEFGNGLNHLRGNLGIRFQSMGKGANAVLFRVGFSF